MSEGLTTTELVDGVRRLLAVQAEHPVYPRLEVLEGVGHESPDGESADRDRVRVRMGGKEVWLTAVEVLEAHTHRTRTIQLEGVDPYNYGYEPPMWAVVDWLIVELRVMHPNEVIEVCIFGGNRAGKTDYAAKRFCEALDFNDRWLLWFFHTDQTSSRFVQQKRIWHYLPLPLKPVETGKTKKGVSQRMSYNGQMGFTENTFGLANGNEAVFKFYSGDADALEGDQPDCVWSDEQIPLAWIKALGIRLLTRAGQTRALVEELKVALAQHKAGHLAELPRTLRARMWRGVHLVTFTPLDGVTPAVSKFQDKASQTVLAQPAQQLPIVGREGEVVGHEYMPRLKRTPGYPVGAAYFWNEDNKHGGNHEGMVKKSLQERWSAAEKKIKFYGYTEKVRASLFAKFSTDVHVKPVSALPKLGTWYHVVDPSNGRNWFQLWALVDPTGTVWIAKEWPPVQEYVEGVGVMGPWVVEPEGKRMDGDPGPAQKPLGWGCKRYKEEIERQESLLGKLQAEGVREKGQGIRENTTETETEPTGGTPGARTGGTPVSPAGPVKPALRIMDSRYGASPNAGQSETQTIMGMMAELDMEFVPSGQTIAAEGENKSKVSEGWQMINDLLDFDATLAVRDAVTGVLRPDPAAAPKMYVLEHCENVIWMLTNYTGEDGQHGAAKDIADVVRYLVIAGPEYVEEGALECWGGGSY